MNRSDGSATVGARRRSVVALLCAVLVVATAIGAAADPNTFIGPIIIPPQPAGMPVLLRLMGTVQETGEVRLVCTRPDSSPTLGGRLFLDVFASAIDIKVSPRTTPGAFGLAIETIPPVAPPGLQMLWVITAGQNPTPVVSWPGDVPPQTIPSTAGRALTERLRTTITIGGDELAKAIEFVVDDGKSPLEMANVPIGTAFVSRFEMQLGRGGPSGTLPIRAFTVDATGVKPLALWYMSSTKGPTPPSVYGIPPKPVPAPGAPKDDSDH